LRLAHVGYFSAPSFRCLAQRADLQVAKKTRARWFFPASYLAERLEAYFPWTRGCHRVLRSIPLVGRLYDVVIPVNLHDSDLFLLRRICDVGQVDNPRRVGNPPGTPRLPIARGLATCPTSQIVPGRAQR